MEIVTILLGIFIFFLVLRLVSLWALRFREGKPAPDKLRGKWGKIVKSGRRALLYFHHPQSPLCKGTGPVVRNLAKRHPNVYRVNLAEHLETAREFGVRTTPTFVLLQNGIIRKFKVGRRSEEELESWMTQSFEAPSGKR